MTYEDLDLPADPGQTILVLTAERGSRSRDASWASTRDRLSAVEAAEEA